MAAFLWVVCRIKQRVQTPQNSREAAAAGISATEGRPRSRRSQTAALSSPPGCRRYLAILRCFRLSFT